MSADINITVQPLGTPDTAVVSAVVAPTSVVLESGVTSTDSVPEGSSNLYFTTARAIAALSLASVPSTQITGLGSAALHAATDFQPAGSYASLDGGGKVPASQLPASLMSYLGTWNASTNSPSLSNGMSGMAAGSVYNCSVAGTVNFGAGAITFRVGDWAVYNGAVWEQSPGSDEVVTVNGKRGDVTLTYSDVGADASGAASTAQAAASQKALIFAAAL